MLPLRLAYFYLWMSSLHAKSLRRKYKNEEEIQSVSTANICVSTFDCFPLSWGIRWGGAHSQYFPIQPFTNSVTSCHNCVTFVSQLCNLVSQSCHNFKVKSPYCTPCTMYSPRWCTVFCPRKVIEPHILVPPPTHRASAPESPRTVSWRS